MIIPKKSQRLSRQPLDESAQRDSSKNSKKTNGISQRTPKKDTYTPKYTKMRNLDGNLVNDRERAETLATYFEQRQWHKTRQTPPEHNIPSNNMLETT